MGSTRREFLSRLAALPLVGLGARRGCDDEVQRYLLNDCYIAGFRYHEGPTLIDRMEAGMELGLVAEPSNPYDVHAIRLDLWGAHVGYVPRNQNRPIARLLEQEAPLSCSITRVDSGAPPWEQVRIRIELAARD